jgi:hypothetical protein
MLEPLLEPLHARVDKVQSDLSESREDLRRMQHGIEGLHQDMLRVIASMEQRSSIEGALRRPPPFDAYAYADDAHADV